MYIKEKNSSEFYNICKEAVSSGEMNISEDEIIDDTKLKLDEKIALLLARPAYAYENRMSTRSANDYTDTPAYKQYIKARRHCTYEYLFSCALACTGGPVLATIGIAYAVYQYDECLDDALEHYRQSK
jgi:hypothetical protein